MTLFKKWKQTHRQRKQTCGCQEGGENGGGMGWESEVRICNPLQHFCLENPHGQRSLESCSPWGHKESDTTERLSAYTHTCKLLHMEWINIKVLPYSTGTYVQYLVINRNGKEYIKNVKKNMHSYIYIYIYISDSYIYKALCCIAEINTTLSINYTSIKINK